MYEYIGHQVTESGARTNRERIIAGDKISDVARASSFEQGIYFPPVHGFYAGSEGFVEFSDQGSFIQIEHIVSEPQFRGKGVGSELLSILEQMAARLGKKMIVTQIPANNSTAIVFFESHGYVKDNLLEGRFYIFQKNIKGSTNEVSSGLEEKVGVAE